MLTTWIVTAVVAGIIVVPHVVARWRPTETEEQRMQREAAEHRVALLKDANVQYAVLLLDSYLHADPHKRVEAMLRAASTVPDGYAPAAFSMALRQVGTIRAILRLKYPDVLPPEIRAKFRRDGEPLTETEIISDFAALLTINGLTLAL